MDTKPTTPPKKTKSQATEATPEPMPAEAAPEPVEAVTADKRPVSSADTPVKPGARRVTLAQARALRP